MPGWKRLRPLKFGKDRIHLGVGSAIDERLPLSARIGVGFGRAVVTRDGLEVWCEAPDTEWADLPRLSRFERMARSDPEHDWRVVFCGALHGETYQRQGRGKWLLVESNEGFA